MPYQEPGPRWRDDSVAVIDPDRSREAVAHSWRTSQPLWVRKLYLPRCARIVCALLASFAALSLLLTLLRPGVFSSLGVREQAPAQQQTNTTSQSLATSTTHTATNPVVQVSTTTTTIYALTPDGTLRAWNMSEEKTVWQKKTRALPNHALLTGKYAIFSLVWNTGHSWLEAWRASDGQQLWAQELPVPGDEPLLLRGENVYVNAHDGTLLALQARTGDRLWSFKTGMIRPLSDFFFATAQVAAVLSCKGEVSLVRTGNGAEIYHYHNALHRLFPTPQVEQGIIYVQSDYSVQAVQISDGRLLWSIQHDGDAHLLPMVVNDGVVYMSQDDGWLKALRGEDGKLLWPYHVADGLFSEPMVQNGMVYLVRKDRALQTLRASDGSLFWQTAPAQVQGQIAVTEHVVYLNIDLPGQEITALQASDGSELWHRAITTLQTRNWTPLIADDLLLFAPDDFSFQAWDGKSGQYLWQYRTPVRIRWEPSFDADHFYVAREDGGVDVLRADTGALLWQYI